MASFAAAIFQFHSSFPFIISLRKTLKVKNFFVNNLRMMIEISQPSGCAEEKVESPQI